MVRMNFRTKPRIKATIQRAAALAGLDDSAFTMQAAYQAARAVISAHTSTQNSRELTMLLSLRPWISRRQALPTPQRYS